MPTSSIAAVVLAAWSKHDSVGVAAVVVGVALIGWASARIASRIAGAEVIVAIGVVAILIGVLLFARVF